MKEEAEEEGGGRGEVETKNRGPSGRCKSPRTSSGFLNENLTLYSRGFSSRVDRFSSCIAFFSAAFLPRPEDTNQAQHRMSHAWGGASDCRHPSMNQCGKHWHLEGPGTCRVRGATTLGNYDT